ncbi:MAG: CsgG/HfaB family protein [Bdellovibrionota bacterium]
MTTIHGFKTAVSLTSALFFLTTGCSLLSPKKDSRSPEIRDVSYQARESREESPRRRIMILPFLDGSTRSAETAKVARDAFIKALKRSDDFVIVSNTDFPKDIATYLKNGEYDLEAMGKIGGGMGLAGIMEGKIIEIKAKRIGDEVGIVRQIKARIGATVQIRMVNTKNGSIALNEMRTAEVEDSTTRVGERTYSDKSLAEDPQLVESVVTEAFKATIPRIVQSLEKLSWEGRVAMVKGDRIYLNAGRVSGLMIGDILKITEEGEDVYDPDSGALIGKVPGRLKGTVELISYFGKDGSIGVIHSGSGFRENDRVELY